MRIGQVIRNMSQRINVGIASDMHVHLRDGAMCDLVTPTVREGGISVAYIMPNLQPPITTLDRVVQYKQKLQELAPKTTFLMSFYLSPQLTPELIHEAASKKAIRGVKCYPAGVTTNSSAGVDPNDFSNFYPIFQAMEKEGLVLNLHGEKPSVSEGEEDIHVLNAEESFLPVSKKLHHDFPNLKIILEHCTTKSAIDTINELNANVKNPEDIRVAATITAHHLYLTIDDWAGNPINFCKPVAKLPADKRSLVDAAISGKPWFFFGSDSAPHPIGNKARHIGVCAGVYTQSLALPYVAQIFEQHGALDTLPKFVSQNAWNFYELSRDDLKSQDDVVLYKDPQIVPDTITNDNGIQIAPFQAGKQLDWKVEWQCK